MDTGLAACYRKLETLRIADFQTLERQTPPISHNEILQVLASFKQKSPGNDGLTKYHLTNLPDNMTANLTSIFNLCLASGHFPLPWKSSSMIFIPKPGKSPLDHSNYRPISLLNVAGKALEKIINKRLYDKLDDLGLHNDRQHGFRKNRGTGTATGLLYELIAVAKANNSRVNVVFRDISKAFDRVWHDGLTWKMIVAHLPDYLIRIIHNYLRDRNIEIRIGNYLGPRFSALCGVPQGGCLSPTLFNFYTHDLPTPLGNNEDIIYADDITQVI